MNPLAARARAISCPGPDTHDVLELIVRSADLGWIRSSDLPELLDGLRHHHDWRSDEIGFEPRDGRALVRFLDRTASCPAAALLDGLAQLIAAQARPCGALLLGHVERRPELGWVVGGADAGLPGLTTEAIRALAGGHAILDGPMSAAVPVLDVSVHAALTGQRYVFPLLPKSAAVSESDLGRWLELVGPERTLWGDPQHAAAAEDIWRLSHLAWTSPRAPLKLPLPLHAAQNLCDDLARGRKPYAFPC